MVTLTFRAPWVITLVSGVWPLTLLLPQKILHKKTWKENLSLSFYSHSSHIPTLEYIRKQIIEYLLSIHFAYYVCISFFEEGCTFLTHSSQGHTSPAGKLPLLVFTFRPPQNCNFKEWKVYETMNLKHHFCLFY